MHVISRPGVSRPGDILPLPFFISHLALCSAARGPELGALKMYRLMMMCVVAAAALADVPHLYSPNSYQTSFSRVPQYLQVTPTPAPARAYYTATAAPPPAARANYYHAGPGASAAIVRQSQETGPDGSYQYGYETSNGIAVQESARITPVGPEQAQKSAQGSYSFVSPEGVPVAITYTADENGFQAYGDAIPTPPPIPPAIQRALAYIAAHPQPQHELQYQYNDQYRRY